MSAIAWNAVRDGNGITVRHQWNAHQGLETGDGRPAAVRPTPSHALSEAERAEVLRVANEPRFADMPPARIVLGCADGESGTVIAQRLGTAHSTDGGQ